jgi:S-adenosylmethionine hydrolase
MKPKQQLCGLITDFGNKDYFTGVMKCVIKRINPGVEVIDISNEIPSYSILPASFTLEQTYGFFPDSSVFLVVVDPGVGTDRNILLVEHGRRFFIGPDNGVLTPVLKQEEKTVSHLDNDNYFLIRGTSTFEARDKMAPAAAYLSLGVDPREMASPVSGFILNDDYFPILSSGCIEGRIVYIDKFGNIMTNVHGDLLFRAMEASEHTHPILQLGHYEVTEFYNTYAATETGSGPFMLIGSHGNLEIAVNRGSAADTLNARIGDSFTTMFC